MLHLSTQRLSLLTRFNQFFTDWNPTNKSRNPLMSMPVFKETLNPTGDQATNPEAPISPQNKSRGPFVSPGTRTEAKLKTNRVRSPLTRAKAEAKTFKDTLIPNLITETKDIDNQVPKRGTPELLFSSQNKIRPVGGRLEMFWKV